MALSACSSCSADERCWWIWWHAGGFCGACSSAVWWSWPAVLDTSPQLWKKLLQPCLGLRLCAPILRWLLLKRRAPPWQQENLLAARARLLLKSENVSATTGKRRQSRWRSRYREWCAMHFSHPTSSCHSWCLPWTCSIVPTYTNQY
jgi:hypothetical protein